MTASSQRLYELDAAKFVAMLFMMAGHVLSALVLPEQLDISRPPWSLWHWWRGITAPVFLTISGMLFSLTLRRNEAGTIVPTILRRRVLRALQLLGIGYLLVLPVRHLYELPFIEESAWYAFVQVNVLQLIAASLIVLVCVAFLFHSPRTFERATAILTLGVVMLTPLVHQVQWYDHLPSALAAYLSYDGGSLFPVFPFSAYMFAGAWMGNVLSRSGTGNRSQLRTRAAVLGLALIALGVGGSLLFPSPDIYRYTPFGVAIRQGVVLLIIVATSLLLPLVRPIQSLLVLFGKQALTIYVLHLVLLYGTPWTDSIGRLKPNALTLGEGILAAAAIIGVTLGSVLMVNRLRAYLVHPVTLRLARVGTAVLLGWLLLV
ncbi:MAG: hypothetical protein KatS3mg039_1657 [Candidatus Kapaibacterium sp.]|nr:MAG: hypothetical protein KatS3mg039_1657 [Candidatus Kapabacteria bacterium]